MTWLLDGMTRVPFALWALIVALFVLSLLALVAVAATEGRSDGSSHAGGRQSRCGDPAGVRPQHPTRPGPRHHR